MSTPMPVVAGWDVPALRGAVAGLAEACERLPRWRARVEAVGRSLETAECWSGPAAQSAAAALVELSGVTTAVAAGLDRSLASFRRLATEAAIAQQLALQSLSGAAEVSTSAATHAAAASSAAAAAGTPLAGLGVVDAFGPARFDDLAGLVGCGALPAVPASGSPDRIARWWAGLSEGDREALIAVLPGQVGELDGVPAWARDRANRLLLARALAHPGTGAACEGAVAASLSEAERSGRPVQLYTFDPVAGLVALAFGDVDTADDVAVLVPGILTTAAGDLGELARHAQDVAAAARAAAPGIAVATVAWLGYRTPQTPLEIVTRGDARRGGRQLDAALDGMAASREATGTPRPRTTVLAHSYGTVVVDQAADLPGRLAADAVVLLGSPGMEPDGALRREAPELYDAAALLDPVSEVGWFGEDTWAPAYGATELPADWNTMHWQYYDRERPTLAALGEVVAGTSHEP